MDPIAFGAFIRDCRMELGLSQTALGQSLNVTAKAISRWERGVGFPDIKLLEPLADALNITLIELMQSKRMEPSLPAETAVSVMSDSVTSIREQEVNSRKQKRDLILGYLIIGGSALFLWWLGELYSFEPWWIGSLLKLIAVTGGVLGLLAFHSIMTGRYLEGEQDSLWDTWKPWAACGVCFLGLVCCVCLKDFFPKGSFGYGFLLLMGITVLLMGMLRLRRLLTEKGEGI